MRVLRSLAFSAIALLAAAPAFAQGAADVPRNETLIVENPEGTIKNAGWFNIWATNAGGQSTGLHQLAMDTFWYIDPDHGLDGVWDNSLASEPPIYNADFTEMTVKLRPGIYWSDGVEFTADDVVFTTNTHLNTNGLVRSAQFQLNVASIEAPDPYTVVFKLKKPNSRFHSLFTVRWNAAWMMPKHVFEGKDPLKFDFNPPVSLGPYTLHSYDPNGQWFTWQKREDWQRTSARPLRRARAEVRDLSRSRSAGQAGDRAAQPRPRHHPRHLARRRLHPGQGVADLEGLVRGLPLRPPGPDAAAGDLQPPEPEVPGPRRALGAGAGARHQGDRHGVLSRRRHDLGDRGAADRHAPEYYHKPMQDWLTDFELDTGKQKIKPYDSTIGQADRRHAAAVGRRPDPDRATRRSAQRSGWAGGSRT